MGNYRELGIDEAGRGPILGPMVLAGVLVPENRKHLLETWGVSDSKSFGSSSSAKRKRHSIASKIKEHFDFRVRVIETDEIDHFVQNHSLNYLEQLTAQKIIDDIEAEKIILDGQNLFKPLINSKTEAINKADSLYISVAAASILAKSERDEQFEQLCEPFRREYGEITGGGYANPRTLDFVKWHLRLYGELPSFYRKSYRWKLLPTI